MDRDMPPAHTLRAFDADLERLKTLVGAMGVLCETQLTAAVDALVSGDATAAMTVVAADHRIDAFEAEIEQISIEILALRSPMADDLRGVVAAFKIAPILERIGDYAKNIAKRTAALISVEPIQPISIVPEMARIVAEMIRDALAAFANGDAEKALAVCQRDPVIDDLYESLFRSLLTFMMAHPQAITPSAHLLFVAKNLERVGDHATNVAELVYYAVTGAHIEHRPRGADVTSDRLAGR